MYLTLAVDYLYAFVKIQNSWNCILNMVCFILGKLYFNKVDYKKLHHFLNNVAYINFNILGGKINTDRSNFLLSLSILYYQKDRKGSFFDKYNQYLEVLGIQFIGNILMIFHCEYKYIVFWWDYCNLIEINWKKRYLYLCTN